MTADTGTAPDSPAWGVLATPAGLVGLGWSGFQIATAIWPYVDILIQRSAHVSFATALALLLTSREYGRPARWLNLGLAALALMPPVIIALDLGRINDRFSGLDPVMAWDYAGALILLVLLIEVSRRVLGVGLTSLAVVFLAYQFFGANLPGLLGHNAANFTEFIDIQFLTLDGVFGIPTGVSLRLVFYFILFAAVFEVFGGGRMIIDISLSLTGARVGGPAKTAVLASGLMGSVSGSAVANVMSTGIFTIPLMKRINYGARFAGAVEAVASTGGQLMPPIMGAAAFILADYLQMPYSEVIIAAIIPALLYFACVLVSVDFEARRSKLAVIDPGDVPGIADTVKHSGHMLVPLFWLAWRIVSGFDVTAATIEAIVISVVVGTLRRSSRTSPVAILNSLVITAERSVNVAIPCAIASLIVSVIAFTGLGTKFTSIVVALSGGNIAAMLGLAMVATLILGAGMPTSSAYIMGAVLIVPALTYLGLEPLIGHFFVLYFSVMSMLTPPVALSAYAAATISGSSPSATGWQAMFLALPGFIIPYAIVLHPGLLLVGTLGDTLSGLLMVFTGFIAISAAVVGWLFRPLTAVQRGALGIIALGLLWPDLRVAVVLAGLLAVFAVWLYIAAKRDTGARPG